MRANSRRVPGSMIEEMYKNKEKLLNLSRKNFIAFKLKNFNNEINNFFMNGHCRKIQNYAKLMRKVSQKWRNEKVPEFHFRHFLQDEDWSRTKTLSWNLLARYRICKMKPIAWLIQKTFRMLNQFGVILAYMCVKLQMRLYVCQAPCPFWVHFGSILGPFWVHFGSISGPFRVHFGSISGPFWVHFGSIWGPFGVHLGSIWGPFGVHFGSILGPFWVHFAYCLSGDASFNLIKNWYVDKNQCLDKNTL